MALLETTEQNLSQFGRALSLSWNIDTCWPNCWNPENPSSGQCRVSAAATQEFFGGDILFAHVLRGTHFWNQLPNGHERDYTREQFGENILIPEGIIWTRQQVMDSPIMTSTYPILVARLQGILMLTPHRSSKNHPSRRANFLGTGFSLITPNPR